MMKSKMEIKKDTPIKMKMMKKDVVMTVGSFSKKFSRDLRKTLKITLEGILYSGGVKVRKFQLVSKKNSIGI